MKLLRLVNLWPPFEAVNNVGAMRVASQDVFVPGASAQTAFSLGTIQESSGTTGTVTQDAS